MKNEKLAPDAIGVAFDVSHHTFRTEEYTEYKANREAMPDPMRIQMGLIYDGLKAFNIPIYTKEGFEADDVIGTISKRACELGHKVLILTGDQDSFQLVDKDGCVKVIIPSKGNLLNITGIKFMKNWVFTQTKLLTTRLCEAIHQIISPGFVELVKKQPLNYYLNFKRLKMC